MTEPGNFTSLLLATAFVIALPISIFGFISGFRAKTVAENIKAHALFVLPILAVFLIAFLSGQLDFPGLDQEQLSKTPDPFDALGKMKPLQLVLVGCAFGTAFIGYASLMHAHWRRTKKKWTTIMNPFAPPYAEFNSREWTTLGGIVVCFLIFGIAALAV